MKKTDSSLKTKLRFVAVGVINTLVDVTVLVMAYHGLGLPLLLANMISTSVAMLVSYQLHFHFTFRSPATRSPAKFVVVTVIGLWVVQPIVIQATMYLFERGFESSLNQAITVLIAKVLAIAASMTWNYCLYSRTVFRRA